MTKPIVLLDIDGVIVDFTSEYLALVTSKFGRVHREEEIHSFQFHESIVSKSEDRQIWEHIAATPGFVYGLPVYEGATDFLAALRNLGRVVACTSPASALWTAERADWLRKVVGFKREDIVVANDKSLIRGDYLIDDHFDNIKAWSETSDEGIPIVLSRPWNQKHRVSQYGFRADNYAEVLAILEELTTS